MKTKIAFFSFADIDNFGDILFSHIFKMEIEKRINDVQIDYYTPSEFSVEGINYIPYNKEKIISGEYDALIVFGGEVIHLFDERTWLPIYNKNQKELNSELPSDIIYDWVDIKGPFRAWISVGVRPFETKDQFEKTAKAIDCLDFVSVRGGLSKKILEGFEDLQYNNTKIHITPDMGWLFPNLLEYNKVKGSFYRNFIKDPNYLIFQINSINENEARIIGKQLLKIQEEENLSICLLPVIRPWEDHKYLKMINSATNNKFKLLPNDLNILEMVDVLVHSNYIISGSLHASITGLSAGIPSGIINKWQGTKLQDIFGHQFRLFALKHDLNEIYCLFQNLKSESNVENNNLLIYSQFMKQTLNNLFDSLTKKIKKK